MALVTNFPQIFQPFYRMFSGGQLNRAFWNPIYSAQSGVVALAGGAQSGSPVMIAAINSVDTVATGGDSVQLPLAIPGAAVTVSNTTGTSCQVFGNQNGTDTINGTAGATGISLAGGKTITFYATVLGKWVGNLSA